MPRTKLDEIRDHNNGRLPAFTSIGCYTMVYYTAGYNELCAVCADDDDTSDPAVDYDVYYEGPSLYCTDCGGSIESSYGDPDAMEVKLDNLDRDDGFVLVTCEDRDAAIEDQSIEGSHWEASRGMPGAYAVISDRPDLVERLEKAGYNVDSSEYSPPEE
jgi:hypothetical protein